MMTAFADEAAKKNCYALNWSFGEMCVGCGCCSEDSAERARARLEYHKECLEEEKRFANWYCDVPEILKVQKMEHEARLEYEKEKIKFYEILVGIYDKESPRQENE